MMEELDNLKIREFGCNILCIFLVLQSTCAQEGFESIQCCAITNFTDPNTNISWAPDYNWYPNNSSCQEITGTFRNNTTNNKARVFSSSFGNKWCYTLTTRKDQDYLIRGTFTAGELQRQPPGTIFEFLIDVTSVAQVNSTDDTEVEGVFKATNDYTNICLSKEQGDPYLSSLELRPVNSEYLNDNASIVLKLIDRVDVGSTGVEIRYPSDPYDRIWRPGPDQPNNATSLFMPKIVVLNTSTILPPNQVLQTALTHPESLQFLHNNLDPGFYEYALYLHFLELNDSVQPGQRVFNIYINHEKMQEIDILGLGSRYRTVVLNFVANGTLNLTMIRTNSGSQLGPICNAYEILQVHSWVQGTTQEDVNVSVDLKNQLFVDNKDNKLLRSWSGDPCLPRPWDGLFCGTSNHSSAITKLDLSFRNLRGPLPPSITKMAHLSELNISNNGFTGYIPAFPSSSMLTVVDLRHNNLIGKIPESLASLPSLVTLLYGCNKKLSKEVPANLHRLKLDTDKGMCSRQGSSSAKGIVIGTVTGGILLIVVAVGICFSCFYKRRLLINGKIDSKGHPMTKNAIYAISSIDDIILKSISIQNFSLENIESATQQYKTLIGEGGFGSVYRGTLSDGQEVAVKVRSATSTQGTREFNNELNLLSAIRHENLVPLLGFCRENDQEILVYPFMSNGSLQDRLYGEAAKRKTLDWPTRLSIALGAARGLTYLHTFSGRCVIHRDVKSSNILLDNTMCAKVADFGFSKYAPQEGDSGASLEVRGTAGYLDPEYYSTQQLSAKSDVFSFGVVLLEIISGREPLNVKRPRTEWSLVEWAKPYIRNSRIDEVVDPNIKGGYHAEAMWRVVEVALACIETFSIYRPSMVDIVRELEDALIIENNASEYMKSIDSFGGSNRFSIERPIIIPPTPTPTETSSILIQPAPPQPS